MVHYGGGGRANYLLAGIIIFNYGISVCVLNFVICRRSVVNALVSEDCVSSGGFGSGNAVVRAAESQRRKVFIRLYQMPAVQLLS